VGPTVAESTARPLLATLMLFTVPVKGEATPPVPLTLPALFTSNSNVDVVNVPIAVFELGAVAVGPGVPGTTPQAAKTLTPEIDVLSKVGGGFPCQKNWPLSTCEVALAGTGVMSMANARPGLLLVVLPTGATM